MASNIEATKKGYEAFQRGDIPLLMKDLLTGARQAGRSGERSRLHQRRRAHDCRRDASSREIFPPGVISIRSDCQAMLSFKRSARKLAGSRISFAAACTHESCATARSSDATHGGFARKEQRASFGARAAVRRGLRILASFVKAAMIGLS
jgi:hypothetical protein